MNMRPLAFLLILFVQSCKHDPIPGPASLKKWDNIEMRANFEVPAVAGRNEEGEASLELLSDRSLVYNFHIHNLTPGDALLNAYIVSGDAGSSGNVLIDLQPSFVGTGASGIVKNLRQSQVDSMLNTPVHINVYSQQAGTGLVRGQIDKKIELAMDIALVGANEVPAVSTTATGNAILRLTDDKVLYSKVTVEHLEANDTLTMSHIHRGGAGANGQIRIFLCDAEAEFGILQVSAPLHDTVFHMLTTDPMYVNVHSRRHGPGIIRGQVR